MRITNSILFRMAKQRINKTSEDVAKYQKQISTGKKVNRPSDDPIAASRSQQINNKQMRVDQYQRNNTLSTSWFTMSESVITQYQNLLVRLKELAIQQGSDQWGPEIRQNAKVEVERIRDHLLALANTRNGNRSLFAGYNVHQNAFTSDGAYNGDSGEIRINLSRDVNVQLNLNGDEVFETAAGKNIFGTMDDFITALETNDTQTIREDVLTEIDDGHATANRHLAELGARQHALTNTTENLEITRSNLVLQLGDIEEVDFSQAVMDLEGARTAFQSALMTASQIGDLTLAKFL